MKTFYNHYHKSSVINHAFRVFSLALLIIGSSFTYTVNACSAYSDFSYSVTNKTVTFTNLSTGVNKYSWGFGDGGTSTTQSPIYTYSASNRYMVYLYAYDSTLSNCYDTTVLEVLVPGCSVHAGFGYSITGSTVNFSNSSTNLLGLSSKFSWNFGNGYTSSAQHPDQTYAGSGPYNVMCVIYDTTYSNCSDTLYHAFSINDCNVVIDFTYTFTGPKTIKVTNTSVHANQFSVKFDSNGEYTYSFPYPGTFGFSIFGRNTWCTSPNVDTTTKTILVPGCHADARFSFGRDTNSTFAGILYDYSTFRAGATYKWYFGDGDSSSSMTPTHTYPGAGKYKLCLTIIDSICVSTYCDTIEYDSSGNLMGLTVPYTLQVIDAVLSVKETWLQDDIISVYPNPGNGEFTIVKDINAIQLVRVFDLQGKLIASEKFDDNKVLLDLSACANGIYMFIITDHKGTCKAVKVMKL